MLKNDATAGIDRENSDSAANMLLNLNKCIDGRRRLRARFRPSFDTSAQQHHAGRFKKYTTVHSYPLMCS